MLEVEIPLKRALSVLMYKHFFGVFYTWVEECMLGLHRGGGNAQIVVREAYELIHSENWIHEEEGEGERERRERGKGRGEGEGRKAPLGPINHHIPL